MAKKKSKKYLEAAKQVEAGKAYDASEALALVKKIDFANFDATIEVAFNLNLDTKQADQQLRGALVLPNGTGKEQTVVVFAKGPKAQEAKDADRKSVPILPVQTLLATMTWYNVFKTVGLTSTLQSQRLT